MHPFVDSEYVQPSAHLPPQNSLHGLHSILTFIPSNTGNSYVKSKSGTKSKSIIGSPWKPIARAAASDVASTSNS